MTRPTRALPALALAAGLVLLPTAARAHGGEDHGGEKETPAPAPTAAGDLLAEAHATSDLFELLLKVPAESTPGEEITLHLYLSDAATNAPAAGATFEIEATGELSLGAPVTAIASERAGIYALPVTFPGWGTYDLLATVKHKDAQDLLTLRLSLEPPAVPGPAAGDGSDTPWRWLVAGAGVLLVAALATGLLIARRRRARIAGTLENGAGAGVVVLAALGALILGAPPAARAHGGEDHGEAAGAAAPAAAAPGAPVFLAKDTQFLLGVRTVRLVPRDLPTAIDVLGEVVPRTDGEASLYPPFTGRLLAPEGKALVRPGAAVRKGDVLALVDGILGAPDRVGLATGAAAVEGRVAAARARAELAKRELARVTGLAGVVPRKRIDEATAEAAAAEAELAATLRERGVLLAASGLNRHVVKAPIDGVVVSMDAAPGEVVDPGKRLFRIIDTSALWVRGKVYETDIAAVESAVRAMVRLDAYPGRSFEATLVTFGSVVDATTRTLDAIFEVPNPDGALRAGMFAAVAIETAAPAKGLAVPLAAVLDREGRPALFVKLGPEQFALRPVRLGRRIGREVEVREGLADGDRVVTEGLFPLKSAGPRPGVER